MAEELVCDICGRSAVELPASTRDGDPNLEKDQDGLRVCRDCRDKLVTTPVGATIDAELIDEIRGLVGRSAGAICFTSNLPYEPPYRSIIDAASKIAYDEDRYMSAWSFVTEWSDGTTVWRDPDGETIAYVPPEGEIRIESR
jgi:hypothetical protein